MGNRCCCCCAQQPYSSLNKAEVHAVTHICDTLGDWQLIAVMPSMTSHAVYNMNPLSQMNGMGKPLVATLVRGLSYPQLYPQHPEHIGHLIHSAVECDLWETILSDDGQCLQDRLSNATLAETSLIEWQRCFNLDNNRVHTASQYCFAMRERNRFTSPFAPLSTIVRSYLSVRIPGM